MTDLPICQHRGDVFGELVQCRSNRWIHGGTVPLSLCFGCRYADRVNIDVEVLREQDAAAEPVDLACKHRGPVIAVRPCDTCGGDTGKGQPVPVYQCTLHGECTLHKTISTVKGCAACEQREASGSFNVR